MKRNKITALIIMVMLIFSVGFTAYAHEVPDLTKKGTLSITIKDEQKGIIESGGSLYFYKVADIGYDGGDCVFKYTDEFKDCNVSLADPQSHEIALGIYEYALEKKLHGQIINVSESGVADFGTVDLGLYLIAQKDMGKKYLALEPFVISVPQCIDGSYVYDVKSFPKCGIVPVPPPEDTPPTGDTPPPGGTIPQTGQLWWPVPILAGLGLLFVAFGWRRNRNAE